MAPKKQPWFRFYSEAIYDPKLRALTPEQRWMFVVCLALARQSPEPGVLMLTDTIPVGLTTFADAAALSASRTAKSLQVLVDSGLISYARESDTYSVTKWSDRQFCSDNTVDRPSYRRRNGVTSSPQSTETEADNPPNPPASGGARRSRRKGQPAVHPPLTEFCSECGGMVPYDCSGFHLRAVEEMG